MPNVYMGPPPYVSERVVFGVWGVVVGLLIMAIGLGLLLGW